MSIAVGHRDIQMAYLIAQNRNFKKQIARMDLPELLEVSKNLASRIEKSRESKNRPLTRQYLVFRHTVDTRIQSLMRAKH